MKPPRVLVPLAPGFEEIEAITVIDILRRAGIEVITAAVPATSENAPREKIPAPTPTKTGASGVDGTLTEQNLIVASRGTRHIADCSLADINPDDLNMIVLPGGQPGANNLRADPRIRDIIANLQRRNQRLAAICAAPGILAAYGALDGRAATSHPVARDTVAARAARYTEDRVVVDGNVVTSRSAGTAMEFAFTLVEILCGPDKVAEVNRGVLANL